MIGKFSTFKNRMDTSYYELLKHIQEISDYKFEVGDLVEVITIKGRTRISPSGA